MSTSRISKETWCVYIPCFATINNISSIFIATINNADSIFITTILSFLCIYASKSDINFIRSNQLAYKQLH